MTQLVQSQRYALMLLAAFAGQPISRRTLTAGLILMDDDALRAECLTGRRPHNTPSSLPDLNLIYTELTILGFISHAVERGQQVWSITDAAPSLILTDEDRERLSGTLDVLRRLEEVPE